MHDLVKFRGYYYVYTYFISLPSANQLCMNDVHVDSKYEK